MWGVISSRAKEDTVFVFSCRLCVWRAPTLRWPVTWWWSPPTADKTPRKASSWAWTLSPLIGWCRSHAMLCCLYSYTKALHHFAWFSLKCFFLLQVLKLACALFVETKPHSIGPLQSTAGFLLIVFMLVLCWTSVCCSAAVFSSCCTLGLVLPLWSDTLIHLDGDG